MTDMATFLADAWVSLCAALGAATVLLRLKDLVQRPEIARRFQFCLWVLVVLMLARIGHWGGWGWLFSAITSICAALIPLTALVLSEGLVRRHAPPVLKQFCAWGGVTFGLLGLFQFGNIEFERLAGLMLFQLFGLGGVALFVLRRDRDSLSHAENRTINLISLSFLLILPFLATDFMRGTSLDLPVRLGGVAVLGLCWLSIAMNRSGLRPWDTLHGFGIVFVVAALLSLIVLGIVPMDMRSGLQVMTIILASLMLLAIWQAAIALRIEDRQLIALREIADADGHGPKVSLELLRRAAGSPDAFLVDEADLADMNLNELRASFTATPVQQLGATDDEQVNWLFSRFDATHAVFLSDTPLQLIMLNSPEIAALDSTGTALRAVQRMAQVLVSEGQA
ncbi:hypothetical protein [Ruegeria sp. Ofav3-42]|uniref:hypothetical protein n=1 Tax=Ruegeria sp. Ofav3-42 TaxID=2917759 RepID=UPI001EF58CA9|nr:hypothetical protein [Ruegeria sp. Ofav3-42]MCG7522432.1 hypothetical protein [Ruegeria sp. Ofav3-42]